MSALNAYERGIEAQALNCAHCDGKAQLHPAVGGFWYFQCRECFATTRDRPTPIAALESWNRRVER